MLIRFASLTLLAVLTGLTGCATNKPAMSDIALVDENGQTIAAPLPDGFEDEYRNGLLLLEDGDIDEAVDHWKSLSESENAFSGVWTNYGLSLFRQGDMAGALSAYENAQAINPKYCPVNSLKGIVLRDLGRFNDAQLSYEKAIDCKPKDGRNYYNLGILYDLYRNDLGMALDNYRKARRLMPDDEVLEIWVVDLARRHGEAEEDPAELDEWEQSLTPTPVVEASPAGTELSDHTELSSEAELSVDTELSGDQKLTDEEQVTTALGPDGSESESIETDVDSAVDAVSIQKGAEVEALVVETREDDTRRLNDGLDAAVIDEEVSE